MNKVTQEQSEAAVGQFNRLKEAIDRLTDGKARSFFKPLDKGHGVKPHIYYNFSNKYQKTLPFKLWEAIKAEYPSLNIDYLKFGTGTLMVKKSDKKLIPTYNMNDFNTLEISRLKETPPLYEMVIPPADDCNIAIPVYGNSLPQGVNNGDNLILRLISNRKILNYGELHIIKTKEITFVKYIYNSKESDSLQISNSMVIDSRDSFDIPKSEIIEIYQVKLFLRNLAI